MWYGVIPKHDKDGMVKEEGWKREGWPPMLKYLACLKRFRVRRGKGFRVLKRGRLVGASSWNITRVKWGKRGRRGKHKQKNKNQTKGNAMQQFYKRTMVTCMKCNMMMNNKRKTQKARGCYSWDVTISSLPQLVWDKKLGEEEDPLQMAVQRNMLPRVTRSNAIDE